MEKTDLPDLIIRVDFHKPSGKWYSGGNVNIGSSRLWKDDFKQAIVNNQQVLMDGWQGSYTVVTTDRPELESDPNYREFSRHVFMPHEFARMHKSK